MRSYYNLTYSQNLIILPICIKTIEDRFRSISKLAKNMAFFFIIIVAVLGFNIISTLFEPVHEIFNNVAF